MDVIEEFLNELDEATLFQLTNVVNRRVRKLATLKRKAPHDRKLLKQLLLLQGSLTNAHRQQLLGNVGDLSQPG